MATVAVSAVLQQGARTGWRSAPRLVSPATDRTTDRTQSRERAAAQERVSHQEARPVMRSSHELEPGPQDAGRSGGTAMAGQAGAVSPERAAVLAEQRELADLAARCLAGDAAAWEKLARTQHRRIYGICYRFTGSQSDAEDLTQEAFLKMYRNLSSFDPSKGAFTTWLTTLTRNLLVDNYRRSRLERASDSLDETYDGEEDGMTRGDRLADGGKSQEQVVAGHGAADADPGGAETGFSGAARGGDFARPGRYGLQGYR